MESMRENKFNTFVKTMVHFEEIIFFKIFENLKENFFHLEPNSFHFESLFGQSNQNGFKLLERRDLFIFHLNTFLRKCYLKNFDNLKCTKRSYYSLQYS